MLGPRLDPQLMPALVLLLALALAGPARQPGSPAGLEPATGDPGLPGEPAPGPGAEPAAGPFRPAGRPGLHAWTLGSWPAGETWLEIECLPVFRGLPDPNCDPPSCLALLPGVGPATAAAIVAERERAGPFRSLDDLDRVPGIGPGRLADLRGAVRLSDRSHGSVQR